jgi:hypothetical protein
VRADKQLAAATAKSRIVGDWAHLAGVLREDGSLELYVDGELAATGQAPGLLPADPAQPMQIGADEGSSVGNYSSPFGITAAIDEVRVYRRALGAEEIRNHAEVPASVSSDGLVLHYMFDASDATDASGNGNHGDASGVDFVVGRAGKAIEVNGSPRRRQNPTAIDFRWSRTVPLHVRAIAVANDTLFIAGPPDLIDEAQTFETFAQPETQALLARQAAALQGAEGAVLIAVSAQDGEGLVQYALESPPVFDGMAVTPGRLYLSTEEGSVLCFSERPQIARAR